VAITDDDLAEARRAVLERAGADGIDLESFPPSYLDRITRQEALINAIGPALVGGDAESFFEENRDAFTERCISHIFVSFDQRSPDEAAVRADDLQALLDGGATFDQLATEESDDQAAAADAGSLGCGLSGRFIPQFEEAANELVAGEVSGPVETPLGFHIIRMDDVRRPTFEEAEEDVARQLQTRTGPAIQEFLIRATTDAEVDVNPRFGEWVVDDELGPGFGRVRPPVGPTTTAPAGEPVFESAP
jgi:parvulin-like peptidyl-prolyl isomerase